MRRMRDRYRWGSPPWWLQAVTILPQAGAGLLPLMLLLRAHRSPQAGFALVCATLLLWAALSGRRAETMLARWVLKLRHPTPAEREILRHPLGAVLTRSKTRLDPIVLIQRSDHINALAYGHNIIAVTDTALELEERHLAAILAHEIGHIAEGHTTFATLRIILTSPLRIYREVGGFLTFASPLLAIIGLPIALLATLLAAPIIAADLLYRPIARWEERSADLYASRIGYGLELAEILHRERPRGIERIRNLAAAHPDGHLRATRLIQAQQGGR